MSAIHKYKYHLSALAVAVIAVILISSTLFAAYEFHKYNISVGDSTSSTPTLVKFTDHVKYFFYHSTHPVLGKDIPFAVKEGDNTVMQVGETCVLTAFYGVNGSQAIGNTTCPIGHLSGFGGARFVGLMNHTSGQIIKVNKTDTVAKVKQGGTGFALSTQGMIFTAGQGAPARCALTMNTYNNVTCTTPAITITNGTLSASGTYIAGAGEINSTSSSTAFMFAEQAFASGVTLHNGDSMIVAWTTTD